MSDNLIVVGNGNNYIVDLLGSYPVCTEPNFEQRMDLWGDLMLALCPLERATTYYFANDGDDSNDGLSPENPKETMTELNTLMAPGVRCRLKRGDVFRSGPSLNCDGGVIDDYGTGPKPRVTGCTQTIAASSAAWTNAAGDRWTTTLTNVGAIHPQSWPVHMELTPAASTAEVEANDFTQFISGSTISVNFGGVDPNTVAWEANDTTEFTSSSPGVRLNEPGSRAENIVADRHGVAYWGGSGSQQWGVMSTVENDEVVCMVNCEAYIHMLHNIGHLNSFSSGGILLMDGCIFGGCSTDTATNFVSFAANGENETLVRDCKITKGPIFQVGESTPLDRANKGWFCHASGGDEVGFHCGLRCETTDNDNPCLDWGGWNDAPAANNNIELIKAVMYKCKFGRGINNFGSTSWYTDTALVACEIYMKPVEDASLRAIDGSGRSGFLIASYLNTDWSNWDIGNPGLPYGYHANAGTGTPKLYHNHIHWSGGKSDGSACWNISRYNSTSVALTSQVVNNIWSSDGIYNINVRYFPTLGDEGSTSSGIFLNNAMGLGWWEGTGSGERGWGEWLNSILALTKEELELQAPNSRLHGQGNAAGDFVKINLKGEELVSPGTDIGPYGQAILKPRYERSFVIPTVEEIRVEIDTNGEVAKSAKRAAQLATALQ